MQKLKSPDDVSMRDIRLAIREEAVKSSIWAKLDQQLGDAADFSKELAGVQSQIADANDRLAAIRADIEAATGQAKEIVDQAEAEAQLIKNDAEALRKRAESTLAAAEIEAREIVEGARAEADRLIADRVESAFKSIRKAAS